MANEHENQRYDDSRSRDGEGDGGRGAGNLLKTLLWTGAGLGVAALANAAIFYRTPPLTSPLKGEVRYFPTPDGDVFYKKAGDGPPLLLVHSIGAGCSSYEFRHIWDRLAERHTVYALDLLGFGKSDKPPLVYTDATFINLLSDFARNVMEVGDGRGEADVIAVSLSAAYVIALSQRDPSLFHRLVLVCPTGIEELASPLNAGSVAGRALLKTPVLGTSLYNGVSSRPFIRYYLSKYIYASPAQVTDEVVDQYYTAAHQPGGEHFFASFASGYLNINIAEQFPHIEDLPLLVWGRDAKITPLAQAEAFLQANSNAKLEVVDDAGALPHEEQPEAFLTAVRPFLYGEGGDSGATDAAAATDTGSATSATTLSASPAATASA